MPGYPTTWGAPQYRDRVIDSKATVIKRLEEAGAVLIAKLATGAFAGEDYWWRGQTRNPWNPHQSASASSSGPASATASGLVGFSLGSETMGSIVYPCARCGAVGLRPTFGRVSRHGCMPLGWSLDKIGPICRMLGRLPVRHSRKRPVVDAFAERGGVAQVALFGRRYGKPRAVNSGPL
jgi:Asp-tRNA(Asn)/Glu-tRNA(Gln) amidotransferase A subunit family amidase